MRCRRRALQYCIALCARRNFNLIVRQSAPRRSAQDPADRNKTKLRRPHLRIFFKKLNTMIMYSGTPESNQFLASSGCVAHTLFRNGSPHVCVVFPRHGALKSLPLAASPWLYYVTWGWRITSDYYAVLRGGSLSYYGKSILVFLLCNSHTCSRCVHHYVGL
jgi:hypothetical protein